MPKKEDKARTAFIEASIGETLLKYGERRRGPLEGKLTGWRGRPEDKELTERIEKAKRGEFIP